MKNKINYAPKALQDLDEIYDYIAVSLQNPIAAKNTIQGIRETVADLKTLNDIGIKLTLPSQIETPYRFIQSGNYLIFYRRADCNVFIDRVIYKKRDYIQVLLGE